MKNEISFRFERARESKSKIDAKTNQDIKKTIEKGKRMTILLRQNDLEPMPIEKEVIVIFTGVNSDIEEVAIDKIKDFEKDVLSTVEIEKPEILKEIRETGDMSDKSKDALLEIIKKVKLNYGA